MNPKTSIIENQFGAKLWRSSLRLLIALAILGGCSLAKAQPFHTVYWQGTNATAGYATNTFTNTLNWVNASEVTTGITTNLDTLVFGGLGTLVPAVNKAPQNGVGVGYTNNMPFWQIQFITNGFILGGGAMYLSNGIVDSAGANSNAIPLLLGANQTFANNASTYLPATATTLPTNTESGTINLFTNTLTIGGDAPMFLTGVISSTNGGVLVDNNSGLTRLQVANTFGQNIIQITNVFVGNGTYTVTTNVYTNLYVIVGVSTNLYYTTNLYNANGQAIANVVNGTNGTYTFTTNKYITSVVEAVKATAGTLQLNIATGLPTGTNVGNIYVDGATLDLNGFSPTINGLDDSGDQTAVIDNIAAANTGLYTLTLGNANSNGIFSGVIKDTTGTVALYKTGYGTEELDGGNQYVGATTVNQGVLKLGSSGSLGQNSPTLTLNSGAVLDVSAVSGGYFPYVGLTFAGGTPTKPFTNYLGSYDPNVSGNFTVSISGTNNVITYRTNVDLTLMTTNVVPIQTNFVSLNYSTNTIVSVINNDVLGDFNVTGGGAISPVTSVSPGIATWNISGTLSIDNVGGYGPNRLNYLLNNTRGIGGGTNDLVVVGNQLYLGDEVDFVITPLTGTLQAGQYTLMTSAGYHSSGLNSGGPANLKTVEARGLSDTVVASGNNIVLNSSGGTANPGQIIWAGTPALNNWNVKLTQNWKTNAPVGSPLYGNPDYFYPLDNVTFNDTGVGSIVLPVVVAPDSVTFNNSLTNYTFTQNQATFMSVNGNFVKNGTGTVTLQNPNAISGTVTINGGLLALGYYNGSTYGQDVLHTAVAQPGDLILGGGEINQNSQANSLPSVSFQDLVVNAGGSAIAQSGRGANELPYYNISNNVTRAVGGVMDVSTSGKAGSYAGVYFYGTNSPDGTNDYGTNGIVGGWATFNQNDWLYANNNYTTAVGAQTCTNYLIDNNPLDWTSTNNVLVGAGSGNSTVIGIASSASIYTLKITNGGPVTLNIGSGQTLNVAGGGILVPSAGAYKHAINGGTLVGSSQDLVVLNQNSTLGSSLTIGSVIGGGSAGLTTAGLGTTILTANNTYTGPTYILNGIAGRLPGTLQVGANGTSGSIATSSAIIDNGNLAFNRSDNDSVAASITGVGNLQKLGAGVLTLTANSSLSGTVTITSGTLQLGGGGASGSVSNTTSLVDNGNLVFDNNNTVSYSHPISGYGSLVQFGTGNLILTNTETYSGNTTVSNGTITVTASGSIANTAQIVVQSPAILDVSAVSGGLTLRSAAPAEILSGNGTVNGSVTTASGTTLGVLLNSGYGTLTINNALNLSGGNYKFNVSQANSDHIAVVGALAENSGTVVLNVSGTLSSTIYPLIHTTAGGLTVGLVNNVGLFGFVQPGSIAVLSNSTPNDLVLMVYPGTIGSLGWAGSAYGGVNDIWNTTSANWTNVGSGLPLTTYANPEYALFDETISYTNPVDIQTAVSSTAITVNSTNFNFVLGASGGSAQKLTGGSSLIMNGSGNGTLTLLTTNDYLGTTAINGGVVQLGNNTAQAEDGLLGSGGGITLNGTLVVSNFATETIAGSISGAGQLVQRGVGKLILTGNNTGFSGGIFTSNNTLLQVGNGFTGTLGTGPVTNNRALIFDVGPTPVSSIVVPGNITGTGGITNLGPGLVQLSGNNSYSGSTVISQGTLQLGSVTALATNANVYMDASNSPSLVGTLDLNGNSIDIASIQGNSQGNGANGDSAPLVLNNGTGTATLTIGGGTATTFYGEFLDNNNGGTGKLALLVTNNTYLTLIPLNNASGTYNTPNLFSGGFIISNATVNMGGFGASATASGAGAAAAGLGTITLLGGHYNNTVNTTNPMTRFPTNAIIFLPGSQTASTTPTLSTTFSGPVNVPAGEVGSIFGPGRGTFSCTLTGAGTLTYTPTYVRGQLSGDWSAFTGTIIFESLSTLGNNSGAFSLGNGAFGGFKNATVFMQVTNFDNISISGNIGGGVCPIGALTGGDYTSFIGGGTQGNGSSGGAANTIWAIGNLGLNTTNGSEFTDGGCGIRVVGGSLTLTNSVQNYGGQTVVSNGTLYFAPLGNLVFTNGGPPPVTNNVFIALTNNYLVGSNFTIVSPGVLDVSQMGGTLYLGHSANGQTLFGNGTLNGNLLAMANSNTVVAPGFRASATTAGTIVSGSGLQINGTATLNGTTVRMSVDPTTSPTYDSIVSSGTFTLNSGQLIVTNGAGGLGFPGHSTNVFKFFPGSVTVSIGGVAGITNIIVPPLPAGEFWVTNLDGSQTANYPNITFPAGSMAIVNLNAAVNTSPFPITTSYNGTTLTLTWPASHIGYRLEAQTNILGIGISNNWVDVDANFTPPANTVNTVNITVDPSQPSVFYRLIYP